MFNMSSFIRCKFFDQKQWCSDNFFFANALKVYTQILDKWSTVNRRYLSRALSPWGSGRGTLILARTHFLLNNIRVWLLGTYPVLVGRIQVGTNHRLKRIQVVQLQCSRRWSIPVERMVKFHTRPTRTCARAVTEWNISFATRHCFSGTIAFLEKKPR